MINLLIFPSSHFDANKIDEELQEEYNAAISTGLFEVILFGYEQWFLHGKIVLNKGVGERKIAIYRGWMMKPEQYKSFYNELLNRNITLLTSPEQYERFHIFPNIYPELEDDTAKMMAFPKDESVDLQEIQKVFKRFMVKDFVKSVKGTEFPKYFDSTISKEEFDKWMQIFYKYRGELYTGGICIKEYLDLAGDGKKTNEYRVFYGNGGIISISPNVGQGNNLPAPPKALIAKYMGLESPYYTIDFAQLRSGEWKIIEAGDGCVSGLSIGQDYEAYYRALFYCFAEK